jgi:hypothetical protein
MRYSFLVSYTLDETANMIAIAADNITRLERDLRFILCYLQTVDGNFDTVDGFSLMAYPAPASLKEMRLEAQLASELGAEFIVPINRKPESADLANAALLVARIEGRHVERVRGFVV